MPECMHYSVSLKDEFLTCCAILGLHLSRILDLSRLAVLYVLEFFTCILPLFIGCPLKLRHCTGLGIRFQYFSHGWGVFRIVQGF